MSENKDTPAEAAAEVEAVAAAAAVTVEDPESLVLQGPLTYEQTKDAERQAYGKKIAKEAVASFHSNVFSNQSCLRYLQNEKKLFTKRRYSGAWFVLFTQESALRFTHAAEKYSICGPFPEGILDTFDFDTCVVFLDMQYIRGYTRMHTKFANRLKECGGEDKSRAMVLQERALAMHPYILLDSLHVEAVKGMCQMIAEYSESSQICVQYSCVMPKRYALMNKLGELSGRMSFSEGYILNVDEYKKDRYAYIRRLMVEKYLIARNTETLMCLMLGRKTLRADERDAFDKAAFRYAARIAWGKERFEKEETVILIEEVRNAVTNLNLDAPCAYCDKHGAKERCKKCFLFRYCNEECTRLHRRNGAEGALEEAKEHKNVFVVTHEHMCMQVAALVRMCMHVPQTMDENEFAAVMKEALKEFYQISASEGMNKIELEEIEADE